MGDNGRDHKSGRRWVAWAVANVTTIGTAIGGIAYGIGKEAIIKVGGHYLEAAIARFTGGGPLIETGAIIKGTVPEKQQAAPQPAAPEPPPCISERPAAIFAKLKKDASQIARYKGACVSWLVALEGEPEAILAIGGWRLWGAPPSTVASRCAALFCDNPRSGPRLQIEARYIPAGLRGDERVRVVAKILDYVPGSAWFNPDGTLKLIEARVTRGGAPSP